MLTAVHELHGVGCVLPKGARDAHRIGYATDTSPICATFVGALANQGSDDEGNFEQRFWSAADITAGSPKQLTLTGSELNVTQACLDPKAPKGAVSTLYVKSGIADTPVPVVTLRAGAVDHASFDLSFFQADGMVEFTVVGNAGISLSGKTQKALM